VWTTLPWLDLNGKEWPERIGPRSLSPLTRCLDNIADEAEGYYQPLPSPDGALPPLPRTCSREGANISQRGSFSFRPRVDDLPAEARTDVLPNAEGGRDHVQQHALVGPDGRLDGYIRRVGREMKV